MLLRKIGLGGAFMTAILAAVAPIGNADTVSEARKAIQAAYDKEAAAAAKLDVNGMYAAHSPDFVRIDTKASPARRKETLKFIKEKDTVFLRFYRSIKRKDVIHRIRLRGNVAKVTCAVHLVTVSTNEDMTKVYSPETDDFIEYDTWVKDKKGWLMTISR